jgi:hypothetical protein
MAQNGVAYPADTARHRPTAAASPMPWKTPLIRSEPDDVRTSAGHGPRISPQAAHCR